MAASPVWQTTVKRANLLDAKTPGSTLFDVELPGLVGIQGIESFVEARRVQQELQVFFAAILQEINDFLRGRTKREAVVRLFLCVCVCS